MFESALAAERFQQGNDFEDYHPWWPVDESLEADAAFLTQPLGAREVGILPDTGAHDNLCGDRWAPWLAEACSAAGQHLQHHQMQQPRVVQGVGHGQQTTTHEVILATGTNDVEGVNHISRYRAPCLKDSNVPGLMGIKSLKMEDALIRCKTGEMWFLGQGGVDIRVSPGTKHFQMKEAPGGHCMLPVSTFVAQGGASSSSASRPLRRAAAAGSIGI